MSNESVFWGAYIGFMIFILIFQLAIMAVIYVAQWKIYEKAGKPGWACLIPIYNHLVLLEIIGKPAYWMVFMFIPIVNIVFAVWSTNLLAKSFGKDEGWTLGLIFVPLIFYPMLAFGKKNLYIGPAGAEGFDPTNHFDDRDREFLTPGDINENPA